MEPITKVDKDMQHKMLMKIITYGSYKKRNIKVTTYEFKKKSKIFYNLVWLS